MGEVYVVEVKIQKKIADQFNSNLVQHLYKSESIHSHIKFSVYFKSGHIINFKMTSNNK